MAQWIPRGTVIKNVAIRKLLASDQQWQLYDTRNKTYILAVDIDLFGLWCDHFSDVENLFTPYDGDDTFMVFASTGSYLISSLCHGPYPENISQLEAFAATFSGASKEYNLENAIYIEEYSMILPVCFDGDISRNAVVFGKWLTGGVEVSVQETDSIRSLTSWIPTQALYKTMELADIEIEAKADVKIDQEGTPLTEGSTTIPSEKFTLVGRKDLEAFINEHIVDVLRKPDEYERMGIGFPGATILYGPPGSGKTFAIEKLAEYLGWPRFDINSESIGSPYIHETGKKISQVFDEAIRYAPSVIIIDEMESYLSEREGKEQHHVEEVAEFLRKIPEAIDNHVLVFAMTNLLDSVDPAIRRRGRFDYIVEVGMASKEEIRNLLEAKMKDLPIDEDVDVEYLANSLSGHPLSDVTFILRESGRIAVKNGKRKIDQECVSEALSMISKKDGKKTRTIGFSIN